MAMILDLINYALPGRNIGGDGMKVKKGGWDGGDVKYGKEFIKWADLWENGRGTRWRKGK
jgi:hypothetical protein